MKQLLPLDWLTPKLWLTATLLGLIALGWGGWRLNHAIDQTERAQRESQEGLAILAEMHPVTITNGPSDASSPNGFTQRLQDALDGAEVPATSLQSVTPRPARNGATPSHRIVMQPVALAPGLRVLERLTQDNNAQVMSLDLRAPERSALDADQRETWRLEAELATP